mmetsp:Transcript_4475/g.4947  ORF Transcript_4475/g.4947 Transcript_4475/m.4947 type:complete len:108 (-) Transcript_4475:588-911(-)
MVVRRCATTMVTPLNLPNISSITCCTAFSLMASRDDVASSKKRKVGFRMITLAIAMRCFCPPDSLTAPSPTIVYCLFGNFCTNSNACACSQTFMNSIDSGPGGCSIP